jgi:hypothetical protein
MRTLLPLLAGLVIGALGVWLGRDSVLPPKKSPEARALELQAQLTEMRLRLAKIDPTQAREREDSGSTLGLGIRAALADVKAGRPVDLNGLYQAIKPLMRDLSPLFDKIRLANEKRHFEWLAGSMTREYGLNESQSQALKTFLFERGEANAKAFNELAFSGKATLNDMIQATRQQPYDSQTDSFMETLLQEPRRSAYRKAKLIERAERVQSDADAKVARLDNIVQLDESQKDRVFSIAARSSSAYSPDMRLEGVEEGEPFRGGDRNQAINAVLRPEQQTRFDQWRESRVYEARNEFEQVGLQLPVGWEAFHEE